MDDTPTSSKTDGVCPVCGGKGFVVMDVPPDHPQFGKAVPCSCQLARAESRRMDRLREMGNLGALADKTFEVFQVKPDGISADQHQSLRIAYDMCREFAENPEGWRILMGGYGCGKTHLAAAIANYQLEHGRPVIFSTVPDMLDHLRASFAPNAQIGYDKRFREWRDVSLLVLDDLGSESPTDWAKEKLYQLLNTRYVRELPTVITTNVPTERLDGRISSRLLDQKLTRVLHISAPDFRLMSSDMHDQSFNFDLYRDMTFDAFTFREEELKRAEQDTLRRLYEVAQNYAAHPKDWLALLGGYGTGKTHLAAAIANRCLEQGHEVMFVTVPDLLDYLRAAFAPGTPTSYAERFYEVRSAALLVLDDVGGEVQTPWAREKLLQIVNHRYLAHYPTVITSAHSLEDIDPRIVSRLLDTSRCKVYQLNVPSYRGEYVAPKNNKRRTS